MSSMCGGTTIHFKTQTLNISPDMKMRNWCSVHATNGMLFEYNYYRIYVFRSGGI